MTKRLPFTIDNIDALQEVYPELVTEKQVTTKTVNRETLYKVVKLNHELGRTTAGVTVRAND